MAGNYFDKFDAPTPTGNYFDKFDAPKDEGMFANLSYKNVPQNLGNLTAGALRGAGSIGATILAPKDMLVDALDGKGLSLESNRARRKAMDEGLKLMGANPDAGFYQLGKIGTEIAGTAGAGGVLANGLRAIPLSAKALPLASKVANAIESGGFNLGNLGGGTLENIATRALGGGISTGIQGGMIDPDSALKSATLGAVIPSGGAALGGAGKYVGNKIVGSVSKEVADLYEKAKKLGVNIPLDRLTNSKPLNALAASLNYVPLSGRAGVERGMEDSLNTALSRTFGQDTPNVSVALRAAPQKLGAQFDTFLKGNNVKITPDVISNMQATLAKARNELNDNDYKIIENQYHNLIEKADANGIVSGQAGYNIKTDLDRIGNRNSNEAFHARQLKNNLMDAYNKSVAPEVAQGFKTLRQQWGNMKDLENLATNGAEGGVSVAKLAGLKHIGNSQIQDLADIASQFVKPRESMHGAAQRVFGASGLLGAGLLGGGVTGALATLPLAMGTSRLANTALNSNLLKRMAIGNQAQLPKLGLLEKYGLLGLPSSMIATTTAQ